MTRQPYPGAPFQPAPITTALHRHMNGILTQWDFHRVQEHPKQSSDEEVMTFQSWKSHMTRQPYPDSYLTCLGAPFQPFLVPTALQRYKDEILTQWGFHRVQEHLKRSSDEEVMTFRSWRSHMTRKPHPDSLPNLPESPFLASFSTHCSPQAYGLNLDSMGFPWSLRTPKMEFGRRIYDLPKLEITHD